MLKVFSIALSSSLCFATPLMAQILPKAPDTGTPSGSSTPGTTRPEISCPQTQNPLTAIVENKGKDFTLSASPTFWFYVPYKADQISRIEFLLLTENERATLYQTSIELPKQPGLIKVTLPSDPKLMLQPNQTYRWRLHLDCQPDRTIEPDLTIDGWIRRVPSTPQLEAQLRKTIDRDRVYLEHQIWYDAIHHSATRYFANPTQADARQKWTQLLQRLNLSSLQ